MKVRVKIISEKLGTITLYQELGNINNIILGIGENTTYISPDMIKNSSITFTIVNIGEKNDGKKTGEEGKI